MVSYISELFEKRRWGFGVTSGTVFRPENAFVTWYHGTLMGLNCEGCAGCCLDWRAAAGERVLAADSWAGAARRRRRDGTKPAASLVGVCAFS